MYNTSDFYRAEMEHRREQMRRDRRPLFRGRRAKGVRNRLADGPDGQAA